MIETAFQTLYESTHKSLRAYLYKLLKDASLADDMVQESYIKLLQAETAHLSTAQLKSYLFTIATNVARDHWRRVKRERDWFEKEPANEKTSAGNGELHERIDVHTAFDRLSPRHRSLLWLAYVEEYEHKEIAQMMKLKEKSIRVLLFRAKQKFLDILKNIGIESGVNHE